MDKDILKIDRDLSYRMRIAEKPGFRRTLARFFAHSGDSWFWGLGLIILWFSSPEWKKWSVYQFFWITILIVLVMTIKFSIRRKRPEGDWGAVYRNTDPNSFPSGHAARAFLIAILASLLGPAWLAVGLWVWAPLVSLARVAMGVHYLSDVIAGAVFGIAVALIGWEISPLIFSAINHFLVTSLGLPLW